MPYSSIAISSGHGKYIRGAAGSPVPPQLDEVDEARKVVDRVAAELRQRGVTVETFHDDTSHDQNTNLNTIVNWHNATMPGHQLDCSIHFNAFDGSAHGTEVLWITQEDLASELSAAISEAAGTTNRGGKRRDDLFFLSNTRAPAVLIETVFCDNTEDSQKYRDRFDAICDAISDVLGNEDTDTERPPLERPERPPSQAGEPLLQLAGACSWFGGPTDMGVAADEPLAFATVDNAPHLFLPKQPEGTTGAARRLNCKAVNYIACRWDYDVTPRDLLLAKQAAVQSVRTGRVTRAWPADWGPSEATNRICDLSQALMTDLDLETDDDVIVIFPAPED